MKNLLLINVRACGPSMQRDQTTKKETPALTRDGKPLFDLAVSIKESKTVAGLTVESDSITRIKSTVELKNGEHLVEVELFPIAQSGARPEIFYRVLGIYNSKK